VPSPLLYFQRVPAVFVNHSPSVAPPPGTGSAVSVLEGMIRTSPPWRIGSPEPPAAAFTMAGSLLRKTSTLLPGVDLLMIRSFLPMIGGSAGGGGDACRGR